MRHRVKKTTLGRTSGPRKALLRGLAANVITYKKITTTKAKAKAVQPLVERMITKAKQGDLAAYRYLAKRLNEEKVVQELMKEIAPKLMSRSGGYTRIIAKDRRAGDGAETATLEIILDA